MYYLHETGPHFDRQPAAGCLPGWRIIVIAEPDSGHEVGGIADEPRIAEILAGAGLAGGGPARDLRLAGGAAEQGLLHHRVHHRDMPRFDNLPELIGGTQIEHFALAGPDPGPDMGRNELRG